MTTNVFLCYALEDEEIVVTLIKSLASLQRRGLVDNIWDNHHISPGLNPLEEIKKQVNTAHLILLLVSPNFIASDECDRLVREDVLERHKNAAVSVIPLIARPSDWRDSPFGHLQPLPKEAKPIVSWPNPDDAYLNIVQELKEVLRERLTSLSQVERFEGSDDSTEHRSSARCDWYAHISIPPNYVDRTEVITGVRDRLLADTHPIALTSAVQYHKPNALHGMGGIGKSVIARALCDDPKMQMRFPDGILWVTLGQTPELVSRMREWVHALGGTITENAPTVDGLKGTLAKLLKDRVCLLILDDVWQSAHAEVFCVGGSRCRLLLTTRDAEIAHKLGAKIQAVPVMTEDEAVRLLEEWADGQLNKVDTQRERQIVKRLGYLPLAVKLAGAQLRRKSPQEWLRTFTVHRLKAHRVEAENIHDSLERTFTLSLNELDEDVRRLYVALAIFKEDEAILQVGIERLWQGLGMSELDTDTADLLDDLAARALLQVDRSSRVVQLHGLLLDFIDAELKERRIETHRALLNAYRTTWRGTGWYTADDDGYLYDHLAYHLHAIGAIDELKGLFADQQWLQKRVPPRDYTYDGYLSDLEIAWNCADAQARRQIETDQEPTSFADCIRYLLIHTSINSIAGNYIPELVARAVEVGLWTPHRALSVAAKVPVAVDRAKMYIAILETVGLSHEQQKEAQRWGVEVALANRRQVNVVWVGSRRDIRLCQTPTRTPARGRPYHTTRASPARFSS